MITSTSPESGFGPAIKSKPGIRHRLSEAAAAAAAANQDQTMATMLMTRLPDAGLQHQLHRLMVLDENRKVLHTHPLNRQSTSVGRSRHSDVCIDDNLVSAKHMVIRVANDACVVNDLDSSNGTFINGQRLSGFQVVKDGDEIMVGKTVLRFATRRHDAPGATNADRQRSFLTKRWIFATAAMFCLALAGAALFQLSPRGLQRFTADAVASLEQAPQSSQQAPAEQAASPQVSAANTDATDAQPSAEERQSAYLQQALAAYAAGRLDNTREMVKDLVAQGPHTPATAQAIQMLSTLDAIQQTHDRALKAQEQKMYTQALEYWDRLLALDSGLIGDRPSYFAIQAEQRVQHVSFDYAVDALRQKNHQKARQLCQVILQIDPHNEQALALLAEIESMT